jgi:hypothetical protein
MSLAGADRAGALGADQRPSALCRSSANPELSWATLFPLCRQSGAGRTAGRREKGKETPSVWPASSPLCPSAADWGRALPNPTP